MGGPFHEGRVLQGGRAQRYSNLPRLIVQRRFVRSAILTSGVAIRCGTSASAWGTAYCNCVNKAVIRCATTADTEVILEFVTLAYRGGGEATGWTSESHLISGQRTNVGEITEAINANNGVFLVAADEDDVAIGCLRLDRSSPDKAHFGLFAVDPRLQTGGTGSALLQAAIDQARQWGVETLAMEVVHQRDELKAWYIRRGFQLTGETSPFPYGDERFGVPLRDDLYFDVLELKL